MPSIIMTKNTTAYKISNKVSLKINQTNKNFIPDKLEYKDHGKVLENVGIAIRENMPVLLVGDTGTGKTSLIRHLAYETKNGFRRVNHNGGTTADDVVGKILINKEGTYWVDGVLIDAMRNGYWYLADEMNSASPEVLFVIHSLLDDDRYIVLSENNGEIVKPHPDFRFFGAINPSEDYAGTRELNKALVSRFVVVKVDYAEPRIEARVISDRTGITIEKAKKLVEFAGEVRSSKANNKGQFVLSTRDLLQWGMMMKIHGKYLRSAETTVLNKVGEEDFESIKDLMALHFKELDSPKANRPVKEKPAASEKETTVTKMKIIDAVNNGFIKIDTKISFLATLANGSTSRLSGIVGEINSAHFYVFQNTEKGSTGAIKPSTKGYSYSWIVNNNDNTIAKVTNEK